MLTVENISKSFASLMAVKDLSFSVAKSEIFGIVGPDGSGKSTLNRMLAAILKPDKGRILLNGHDVFKNPYTIKEKIAYMPQRFGLYEDLSVEENLYFFGRLFGMSGKRIKQQLPELYAFSRLEPFKKRLAGRLSGGMKQKLGLACCLIHRPELIILDEPTNGVDPISRREFWKILYDLLSRGVTIIVSTAYLDEAERCNTLGLMHRGRFITQGDPLRIKQETGRTMIEIAVKQARQAGKVLKTHYPGVLLKGDIIKTFVKQPSAEKKRIGSLLRAHNMEILSWTTGHPTLEDCFIDIISRRGSSKE
ncbi:MAG: ABC transporter ATP-binding protein [Spirochaetales bacterium]|nr:ABC transporter ATP-binding protein [Spirochaetales bacterium]